MEKVFEVENLGVETRLGKRILSHVNFSIAKNQTVVLIGPNGAGKSTVAGAIMGDPRFKASGSVKFFGEEMLGLSVDERAARGIFMSFQSPVEIPGISTTEMIRAVLEERKGGFVPIDEVRNEISAAAKRLFLNIWFSERELNVGFSGGEKKKNEILQMLSLKPKLVILDELDSGLDVDAGRQISQILADYQKESGCAYLIITHNLRVLSVLRPSKAVLLNQGHVVAVEDEKLLGRVESEGFKAILSDFEKKGAK
jgi:Fe-S cluster assembly ATP-binding protein